MFSEQVDRLNRLPQAEGQTWQGVLVRFPGWVTGESGEPYRPVVFLWGNPESKWVAAPALMRPDQLTFEAILNSLITACEKGDVGFRPARVEVKDPELGTFLREPLGRADIQVAQRMELAIDEFARGLTENVAADQPPGLMSAKGVGVEEAALTPKRRPLFHHSGLWEHLIDDDLIHVESPHAPAGMGYVAVMGAAGMTYGLSFADSPQARDWMMQGNSSTVLAKRSFWSLTYGPAQHMPFSDLDLWEDEALPLDDARAYPFLIRFGPGDKLMPPSAAVLRYVEGLMRVLAVTSEEEIDKGRWEKTVTTGGRQTTYVLSLPDLLKAMEGKSAGNLASRGPHLQRRTTERVMLNIQKMMQGKNFGNVEEMNQFLDAHKDEVNELEATAQSPLEMAQELMYQAFDVRGRRQVQLVRERWRSRRIALMRM